MDLPVFSSVVFSTSSSSMTLGFFFFLASLAFISSWPLPEKPLSTRSGLLMLAFISSSSSTCLAVSLNTIKVMTGRVEWNDTSIQPREPRDTRKLSGNIFNQAQTHSVAQTATAQRHGPAEGLFPSTGDTWQGLCEHISLLTPARERASPGNCFWGYFQKFKNFKPQNSISSWRDPHPAENLCKHMTSWLRCPLECGPWGSLVAFSACFICCEIEAHTAFPKRLTSGEDSDREGAGWHPKEQAGPVEASCPVISPSEAPLSAPRQPARLPTLTQLP